MDNPYGLQRYGTADLGDLMERITKNSIGLDTYFENIFNVGQQQSYPPYNIVHVSNVESRLEIALSGFKKKEIKVYTEYGKLVVEGTKENKKEQEYLHRGLASRKEKKLYQSCHILHKQGKYFIVHFKELFALDGKFANLTINDVQRRNRITRLLSDWGLISILKEESIQDIAPLNQIKVLPYKDKNEWKLEQKYNIGKKNKVEETVS